MMWSNREWNGNMRQVKEIWGCIGILKCGCCSAFFERALVNYLEKKYNGYICVKWGAFL